MKLTLGDSVLIPWLTLREVPVQVEVVGILVSGMVRRYSGLVLTRPLPLGSPRPESPLSGSTAACSKASSGGSAGPL